MQYCSSEFIDIFQNVQQSQAQLESQMRAAARWRLGDERVKVLTYTVQTDSIGTWELVPRAY